MWGGEGGEGRSETCRARTTKAALLPFPSPCLTHTLSSFRPLTSILCLCGSRSGHVDADGPMCDGADDGSSLPALESLASEARSASRRARKASDGHSSTLLSRRSSPSLSIPWLPSWCLRPTACIGELPLTVSTKRERNVNARSLEHENASSCSGERYQYGAA